MCTNEQRDEIIAEILATHTRMPRRYAAWLVDALDQTERTFVTRAAIAGRKSLAREVQIMVHRRKSLDRGFPENIGKSRVESPESRAGRRDAGSCIAAAAKRRSAGSDGRTP